MYQLITTPEAPFRVLDGNVYGSAQVLGRSRTGYTPVDPSDVCAKLNAAGYDARWRPAMGRDHRVLPGIAVVTVESPLGGLGTDREAHHYGASIYLSHYGDSSIKLVPQIIRVACANQFHFPALAIPHCSERARLFVDDPTVDVRRIIEFGADGLGRIEALRGRPDNGNEYAPRDGYAYLLLRALRAKHPRLGKAVCATLPPYIEQDGPSAWAFVQACAVPGARPGLRTLVTDLLTVGYSDLMVGVVPTLLS